MSVLPCRASPGLAAALALALAACANDGDTARQVCPESATLEGADQLTQFAGAGRDLTDVRFEARIRDIALACRVEADDGKRTVESLVEIVFQAEKGPRNERGRAEFTYFVAVVNSDEEILSRRAFDLGIDMPGNQTRVRARDRVSPTIPLPEGASPADYTVYVGFELTRAQLDYNRRGGS
jgi:hypothetical protein